MRHHPVHDGDHGLDTMIGPYYISSSRQASLTLLHIEACSRTISFRRICNASITVINVTSLSAEVTKHNVSQEVCYIYTEQRMRISEGTEMQDGGIKANSRVASDVCRD